MPINLPTYIRRLQDLELIEPAGIDFHLERYHNLTSGQANDPDEFGQALVAARLLTAWQHGRILAGRADSLRLAGYNLTDELKSLDYLAVERATGERARLSLVGDDSVGVLPPGGWTPAEFAMQVSSLESPYVTHLRVVTRHRWQVCLVDEYGAGILLQQIVGEHGPLDIPRTVLVFRDAARGLAALDTLPILPRTVTPTEVIVNGDSAKVSGFTLSRSTCRPNPEGSADLVNYLAPESTLDSDHMVGRQTIVYSLGCTLCFALTGAPPFPFEGRSLPQLMMQHHIDPVPAIRSRRSEIPPWLAALCERMLAKRAAERPDIEAVCHALEAGLRVVSLLVLAAT